MANDLPELEFRRFWQRLQALGLNAYEARSYLVLLGHPRFKAMELAARARVPRQKVYEVLEGLVEKGFAQVIHERTKLFTAVSPEQAVPGYLEGLARSQQIEMAERTAVGRSLAGELMAAYARGQCERGTLDFLRLINDPSQTAAKFRKMLSDAQVEYLEFARPPYAVDPLAAGQVVQARNRGVSCRLLVERGALDAAHERALADCRAAGVEIRQVEKVPLKMAVMDGQRGLLALLDPVLTRPAWTAIVFEHPGMGEAMKILFEEYWRRGV
jgi:hypothetical protein